MCRTSRNQQARQAVSATGLGACSASTVQRAWHHPRLPCSEEEDPLEAEESARFLKACLAACGRVLMLPWLVCHACKCMHMHTGACERTSGHAQAQEGAVHAMMCTVECHDEVSW
jgi:hypothetical protein